MTALEKVRAKLAKINNFGSQSSGNMLKLAAGKTEIRILPNFALTDDTNEQPFVPLYFYHDFGRAYQLAPNQFDRPDPIFDAYRAMYKDTDPDVREMAKKLNSRLRVFVPVLVRGREAEGVQFWGFGFNVYNDLRGLYENPQWGNISDLQDGVDLTVEYIPSPDKNDQRQAKTLIVPNRKSSPATTDADLLDKIKKMPDVTSLFTEPTAAELKLALEKYLGVNDSVATDEEPVEDATDFDPKKFTAAKGAEAPKAKPKEVDDVEAEFEKILASGGKK